MLSFVDQLKLQGVFPQHILLFGAAAFDDAARDVDYMVYDDQNDSNEMMTKMNNLDMKFKCLKSSDFAGTMSSVELYSGSHNNKSVDVCVVNDPILWTKWCFNATLGKEFINVVSKDVQIQSYYHMAKSVESTPIELIKATSGLIVMALLFVDQSRFYKTCVGMVNDLCFQREELSKFKKALENNMVFTDSLLQNQVSLVSEVNQQKQLTSDCQKQLETVFRENGLLHVEISDLKEALAHVKSQQNKTNADMKSLRENIVSLQRELSINRQNIDSAVSENQALREQLQNKESEIRSLEQLNEETSSKNVANSTLENKIASLTRKSETLNATINELKQKLVSKDNDMMTITCTFENKDSEIDRLKAVLDEKNKDLVRLTGQYGTLNSQLTGLKTINMQYELALKHPSSVMDTVMKQFISDTIQGHDFDEPIGLDGNLLRLSSDLSGYFHLAFITHSTDNITVFTCVNAGFGFAFNLDRSSPCCQMIMVFNKDQHLHVCLSDEIPVERGMFNKPIDPLVRVAKLASSHPLNDFEITKTSLEAVMNMPRVLSIILQRLCCLNEKSLELAKKILNIDDSFF